MSAKVASDLPPVWSATTLSAKAASTAALVRWKSFTNPLARSSSQLNGTKPSCLATTLRPTVAAEPKPSFLRATASAEARISSLMTRVEAVAMAMPSTSARLLASAERALGRPTRIERLADRPTYCCTKANSGSGP